MSVGQFQESAICAAPLVERGRPVHPVRRLACAVIAVFALSAPLPAVAQTDVNGQSTSALIAQAQDGNSLLSDQSSDSDGGDSLLGGSGSDGGDADGSGTGDGDLLAWKIQDGRRV